MTAPYDKDEIYMRCAISEAQESLNSGEVPIGAVVVFRDRIVGRGHNLVEALGDATAHAEMQAITSATATLGSKYLTDCTLYVTVEPCVMCAGAIFWSQLGRLVYGAEDPKRGYSHYSAAILPPKTAIRTGVLRDECSAIIKIFFEKLR